MTPTADDFDRWASVAERLALRWPNNEETRALARELRNAWLDALERETKGEKR